MKKTKIIFGFLGLLLLVTLAGAAYLAVYLDRHKGLLESSFSKALDREVRIEDGVKLHWSLMPSIALQGLWVGNPDWAKGEYLARAEHAVLQLDLMQLLRRRLDVKQVTVHNADIYFETGVDGRHNWSFAGAGSAVDVDVEALKVTDSRLRYRSPDAVGQSVEISHLTLNVQASEQLMLKAEITYRDVPLSISGTSKPLKSVGHVGPLSSLLAGQGQGIDLSVHHNDLKVRIHGALASFDQPLHSRLDLEASAPSLSRLTPWFGVDMPETPPFVIAAQVKGSERRLQFKNLKLTSDKSDINGEMSIPLVKGERVEGTLESRSLNLEPFLALSDPPSGDTQTILERELVPEALQGLNGSLRLKVGDLYLVAVKLEQVSLEAELDHGHLKLTMAAENERLTAGVDLKPVGTDWQLALNHKGKLDIGDLIDRDKHGDDASQAPLDVVMQLKGTGRSLSQMLGSAEGEFTMVLGAGRLSEKISRHLPLGGVLYNVMNVVDPASHKGRQANLECAVIQLDLADGIATSSKGLALRTDQMNLLGGGALKLHSGEIDLQFKTAQRKGLGVSIQGVAERFIHVTGTLGNPSVGVNAGDAVAYGGAAWATAGLSLLADSIFTRLSAFSNPCEHVLKAVEKK